MENGPWIIVVLVALVLVVFLFSFDNIRLMPYYPPHRPAGGTSPVLPTPGGVDNVGEISRGACGLYGLDSSKSTRSMTLSGCAMRDRVLLQICGLGYVEGYAWRQVWSCFEPTEGNYDFSGIDYMISLAEQCNKSLSLSFGVAEPDEPDYILDNPEVTTYSYTDSDTGELVTRAVPWDSYLTERFDSFMENLGNHEVMCHECGDILVPLREHPSLSNLRGGIPGVGHLRDRQEYIIAELPGYSRKNLLNAVGEDLSAVTDNFPEKQTALPMWKIQDGEHLPESWEAVLSMVLTEFNGVNNARVGFFMENLAASRDLDTGEITGYPHIDFAAPVYLAQNSTHTEFQMLTSWTTPFANPDKIANTEPVDAVNYGWETFSTQYFEVYGNDLLNASYQPELIEWVSEHCGEMAALEGTIAK
ncbi:MAG: hypothetical protein KKD18_01215 [Nanoarchaeota archaeon]|nr:hypothetical protein [Nanoarchaeota archaeon]MBU0977013.1 hypothetical protein [Nanoarchaeota archaeon]